MRRHPRNPRSSPRPRTTGYRAPTLRHRRAGPNPRDPRDHKDQGDPLARVVSKGRLPSGAHPAARDPAAGAETSEKVTPDRATPTGTTTTGTTTTDSDVCQDRKNPTSAVGGEIAPLFSGKTNLKDGHWLAEPFEIERTLGIEIKSLPNTEFTHRCRNSDATRRCRSAKSSRQLNSSPEQVASFSNWLPDADPNTEVNGPFCTLVPIPERTLNVYG